MTLSQHDVGGVMEASATELSPMWSQLLSAHPVAADAEALFQMLRRSSGQPLTSASYRFLATRPVMACFHSLCIEATSHALPSGQQTEIDDLHDPQHRQSSTDEFIAFAI